MSWLREPLVHFLLVGAALFGIFAVWGGPAIPTNPTQYQIILTPTILQNLDLSFSRAEGRAPDPAQHQKLVDAYVREEILNREARALGLDLDDPLIRRQLSDKMQFYLEDTALPAQPTDAQLDDFLQKNAALFRRPGHIRPTLMSDRPAVLAAWLNDQRQQAADAAYQKLRTQYAIIYPAPPPTITSGNSTTAPSSANTTAPSP
jgi:hypothetical protein